MNVMSELPLDGNLLMSVLRRCETWIVTTHVRPDADAIGSAMAAVRLIEKMGRRARLVADFSLTPKLQFLDPDARLERLGENVTVESLTASAEPPGTTGILVVDMSSWSQMGGFADVFRNFRGPKVIVDHHLESVKFDPEVMIFRDSDASAAGELLLRLIQTATEPMISLDASLAVPLFAALATDTGWFRFDSVTSTTYRSAATLMEAGAEPATIYRAIYEQESFAGRRLLGRFMDHIELHFGGRLATVCLSRDDFAQTGALRSDCEDMVNEPLRIRGVQIVVFLSEQEPKPGQTPEIRLSFRSSCDFNCAEFAKEQFGGGGHAAAAGATSFVSLEQTLRQILSAMEPILTDGKNPDPGERPDETLSP
ncbi:MAG: DHH family phosphoesterase [Planctomycetia bacterium]|nr:DHH family phosphoesterase [Planctomycetia bacterium]